MIQPSSASCVLISQLPPRPSVAGTIRDSDAAARRARAPRCASRTSDCQAAAVGLRIAPHEARRAPRLASNRSRQRSSRGEARVFLLRARPSVRAPPGRARDRCRASACRCTASGGGGPRARECRAPAAMASASRSGSAELLQPPRIERDQRLAQVLQRMHGVLAPGLRRRRFGLGGGRLWRGSSGREIILVGRAAGNGAWRKRFAMITDRFPAKAARVAYRYTHRDAPRAKVTEVSHDRLTHRRPHAARAAWCERRRRRRPLSGRHGGARTRCPPPSSTPRRPAAPRPPKPRSRRRSARASPCARAKSRPSPTTATRASASPCSSGKRRGNASTADFSDESIRATVDKALAIARYTAEDDCGRPRRSRRASRKDWPDLDLYHPWDLPVERGDRARAARPKPRRCASTRASPTAKARRSRAANRNSSTPTRSASPAATARSRHHIDCSVIGEDDDAMQRDYWYTAARAADRPATADDVGRIAGERTARRLERAPAGHARMPGAVRGAGGRRPHRLLRAGGVGRQPVSQVVVPARLARPARSSRRTSSCARSRTCCAARGSAPFDSEGVATVPRDVVQRRRRAGLFPGQLFGAQARHGVDRQRRRQPQPRARSRRRRPGGAAAAHGPRPLRHRAAGAGRQSGDRRFLARRGGLLDRRRRHRLSRSRRSRSPATCATCSATSWRSATTSTGAARATRARS